MDDTLVYDHTRSWFDESDLYDYEDQYIPNDFDEDIEDEYPMQEDTVIEVSAPYIAHATKGFTQLVIEDEEAGLTLRQCQEAVGGYVQRVFLGDGLILLVNEDGLSQNLPINAVATALLRSYITDPAANVMIVGDVIVAREDMFK